MQSPWGMDGIEENTKTRNVEQQNKLNERYQLYANVFNTTDGRKVLEELRKILNGSTWNPDRTENHGYYREGQNSIIRHIITCVENAKS